MSRTFKPLKKRKTKQQLEHASNKRIKRLSKQQTTQEKDILFVMPSEQAEFRKEFLGLDAPINRREGRKPRTIEEILIKELGF